METAGGGWTLAAYCPQASGQNFFDLRCGGGTYAGLTRTSCASLPSVALARASTEVLFARSDADDQAGDITAYTVANKFDIPDPTAINFVNHSRWQFSTSADVDHFLG